MQSEISGADNKAPFDDGKCQRICRCPKKIADQLDSYVREMQREIRNYYMMKEVALQYSSFAFLKDVYDQYYSKCEFEWDTVQLRCGVLLHPL